jgi:hypothetical protein
MRRPPDEIVKRRLRKPNHVSLLIMGMKLDMKKHESKETKPNRCPEIERMPSISMRYNVLRTDTKRP